MCTFGRGTSGVCSFVFLHTLLARGSGHKHSSTDGARREQHCRRRCSANMMIQYAQRRIGVLISSTRVVTEWCLVGSPPGAHLSYSSCILCRYFLRGVHSSLRDHAHRLHGGLFFRGRSTRKKKIPASKIMLQFAALRSSLFTARQLYTNMTRNTRGEPLSEVDFTRADDTARTKH